MINCDDPRGCIRDECINYDGICIVTMSKRNKSDEVVKIFNDDDKLSEFYNNLREDGFRQGDTSLVMLKDGITYIAKWYELCTDTGDVNEMYRV